MISHPRTPKVSRGTTSGINASRSPNAGGAVLRLDAATDRYRSGNPAGQHWTGSRLTRDKVRTTPLFSAALRGFACIHESKARLLTAPATIENCYESCRQHRQAAGKIEFFKHHFVLRQ